MTLVADRFIRFDDGTVRDLATGERVTLIEITLTERGGTGRPPRLLPREARRAGMRSVSERPSR